jgi:MFS family permease
LRSREFRGLWFADLQSLLGDQIARVALTVIVFDRTGSGFLTALVYAMTYLPALIGPWAGVLADRLPRRQLLVGGDLVRAVLVALMAVPGIPLPVLVGLLIVVVAVGTPWKAAESALVADILAGEGYALGVGLRVATVQGAQLAGFAAGGAFVALLGPRGAIALDAATFVVSALVISIAVKRRPPAGAEGSGPVGWRAGLRAVFGDANLRTLVALAWLAGVYVVPEGLAAPYAAGFGSGPLSIGLLLASAPAGMMVASLLFVRLLDGRGRRRLMVPMAVGAGLPLIGCVADLGLGYVVALWAASGACMAYQTQVIADFVQLVPASIRGQAIAVASSGLLAAQGVGLSLGGALAQLTSAQVAVAAAGATGSLAALATGTRRRRLPAFAVAHDGP